MARSTCEHRCTATKIVTPKVYRNGVFAAMLLVGVSLAGCGSTSAPVTTATAESETLNPVFSTLADRVSNELRKPFSEFQFRNDRIDVSPDTHHQPFFEDAYGARALCVAYDETHYTQYLDTSRQWADQMITFQQQMNPAGAYYMNYFRKPGESTGDWYVADANSIALAVLAVGKRTGDPRYLNSVLAYVQLVQRNYVGPDGGVSDGIWGTYTAAWWSSTATYGTLLIGLYGHTHDPAYLQQAAKALDWINKTGLNNFVYPNINQDAPAIMFYTGSFFAAATQVGLQPDNSQIIRWLAENQKSVNPKSAVDYFYDSYMAGMPAIQYQIGQKESADKELLYLAGILPDGDVAVPQIWPFITWMTASYAGGTG
jgi:uncharacterized protein YyaL (SSP411 family)